MIRFDSRDARAQTGDGLLGVYLFYKGVHSVACARVAHHYWEERGETGRLIARLLHSNARGC